MRPVSRDTFEVTDITAILAGYKAATSETVTYLELAYGPDLGSLTKVDAAGKLDIAETSFGGANLFLGNRGTETMTGKFYWENSQDTFIGELKSNNAHPIKGTMLYGDGKIYDDKVGLLNLSGKTLDEARKYLKTQYVHILLKI